MARNCRLKGPSKASVPPKDFYEAEDVEPDEERHAGQRYDVSTCNFHIFLKILLTQNSGNGVKSVSLYEL